jgi:hypothetical protein
VAEVAGPERASSDPVAWRVMTGIDYLALIREAPDRARGAGSCSVRLGNQVAGADSAIEAFEEGIIDFVRRWTVSHQELRGSPPVDESHRPGPIQKVTREILDAIAAAGQRVYVNGVVFVRHSDGQFGTAGIPSADAPRHPNDPAWFVEILYGAVAPVQVLAEAQQGDDVLIHLAGIMDLAVADHSSPYGVLRRRRSNADAAVAQSLG